MHVIAKYRLTSFRFLWWNYPTIAASLLATAEEKAASKVGQAQTAGPADDQDKEIIPAEDDQEEKPKTTVPQESKPAPPMDPVNSKAGIFSLILQLIMKVVSSFSKKKQ